MTTDQLRSLLTADPSAVLESDRRFYFKQIAQAAELIAANARQRPVVLLAGPSGSGKTTTALLIERELDRKGAKTVYARCPLSDGVSMAVYNRLIRAAAFRVVEV